MHIHPRSRPVLQPDAVARSLDEHRHSDFLRPQRVGGVGDSAASSVQTTVHLGIEEGGITSLIQMVIRRDIEPGERGHASRVASLAQAVAAHVGYSNLEAAYLAGLLHDVGKAMLPLDPATIPRQLTEIEAKIVRTHPILGAVASAQAGASEEVVRGIFFHHERLDGSGYPLGIEDPAVPMIAQIVGVADVYDALVSIRFYKPAWRRDRVQAYLRNQAGSSLAREVVEAVLSVTAAGSIEQMKVQL